MEWFDVVLLLCAGIIAGGVNAVAGGGTFFTFPALVAVGLPPITANASSAVAVWPGHAAAVPAYWGRLHALRSGLIVRCMVALAGALVGAGLLLASGDHLFSALVPWLVLFATVLFAVGGRLRSLMLARGMTTGWTSTALLVEFIFAVYGGYFGAGLGVLLLTALTLVGHEDFQDANALKNLLATVVTAVAVITFGVAGVIAWAPTLVVLIGAVLGGFWGAKVAQRVPAPLLRACVIVVGLILSGYFFAA